MRSMLHVLVIVILPSVILAGTAVQTDWSGGAGVPGPVTDWASVFDTGTSIGYSLAPGSLTLELPYGEHMIDDDIESPVAIALADFNGDGSDDAAVCGKSGIAWLENSGGTGEDWIYNQISTEGAMTAWIQTSDLDQDGDIDVIVSLKSIKLSWWENHDNGGSWTEHIILEADVWECTSADFDADGYDDIGLIVRGSSDVMWWRNRLGSGHDWSPNYIDGAFVGGVTCDAADMNGDGTVDIAVGSYSTGEIALYLNSTVTDSWEKITVTPYFEHPLCVRIADINGDGLGDVTGVSWTDSSLVWWRNTNWTFEEMPPLATDLTNASRVCPADLDDDGDIDLLGVGWNVRTGSIRWYANTNGTGAAWELVDSFDCWQAYDIALGDVNGDGIEEFAAPATCQDKVLYWRIGGYNAPGMLESSILDTGSDENIWDYLHWDSEEIAGTDIRMRVRGSADPASMGPWSAFISEPCNLAGLLDEEDRFIQYAVELTSDNPRNTPVLNDISILWSATGISGIQTNEELLFVNGSNPSTGDFELSFGLVQAGQAELTVLDLAGRTVRTPANGWYEAGSHSTSITGLPSGLYICRLIAPEVNAQLRMIVIR